MFILIVLTACTQATSLQKSMYEDDRKLSFSSDSYTFSNRIGTIEDQTMTLQFGRFYGSDLIWTIEGEEEATVSITYSADISAGDFKVVAITEVNEVETLFEGSGDSLQETIELKGRAMAIKVVGKEAAGKVAMAMSVDGDVVVTPQKR